MATRSSSSQPYCICSSMQQTDSSNVPSTARGSENHCICFPVHFCSSEQRFVSGRVRERRCQKQIPQKGSYLMVTLQDTLFKIKERQRCTPILFQFNHVLEVIANEKLNKKNKA